MTNKKQTSRRVASAASRALRSGVTSPKTKKIAGSALAQARGGGSKQK